ncbi:MAG: GMC family oxidoreductase N-terminal domain-containing protein [Granulosicoccus sp.]
MTDRFDYIVIGAGSAGCVLANRLSSDGTTTVALLEAGGRDWNPWIHIPVGYFKTIHNPSTDWCYVTEPDPGLNGRSLKWPRGKVLGGSSSINGLLYVRGQHQDYDRWASELGCPGWSYNDVLPYFRKSQNQSRGESRFHGKGGPLHVSDMSFSRPICDYFIQGVNELGTPLNNDINGCEQEGTGYFQLTAHRGRRCSSATAYLNAIRSRRNLSIITHAMVKRIRFEQQRATSIECLLRGKPKTLFANGEIILCAGTIGSPQLLQVSGIGPGKLLQSLGISIIADRQQTGENLQDHLQLRSVYKTCLPITLNDELASAWQKLRAAAEYAATRSGPLSMAASQVYAFCQTRLANERPDIQYHFQPLSADSPGEGLHPFPAVTAAACQLRPESRGSVQIVSPDVHHHPRIVTNYLSTDLDCSTAIEALRYTRRIMQGQAMRKHIAEELLPNPAAQSDEALLDQARSIGNTIYHPTSTCRMGTDAEAVVNARLQVNGVEGLRVIDASIMPEIISGNTNAPTIMIGEKGADLIIEDQRQSPLL